MRIVSWTAGVGPIGPRCYSTTRGRQPKHIATMLRTYLLQVWEIVSEGSTAAFEAHGGIRDKQLAQEVDW